MRIFYSLILIAGSFAAQAQEDVVEKVAMASCECIEDLDLSTDSEERDTQLGLCILQAASEYKTELKAQYDIDLSSLGGRKGEKFGEQVGMKMAAVCPNTLLAAVAGDLSDDTEVSEENLTLKGKLVAIDRGQFYTIEINSDSRNHTVLWLESFDNSYDLLKDSKKIVGKDVMVYYRETELFDPQINEYRKFKVINKLEWL